MTTSTANFISGGGKIITDFTASYDFAYAVKIQADGKILAVGTSGGNIAVARYNINGSLDTSFGTGGVLTTNVSGGNSGQAVTIQADGKIVVAGYDDIANSEDFSVVRYNTNGSLDTSFGSGGKAVIAFGGIDLGFSVTIDASGRIIVAGSTSASGGGDFAVARLTTTGALDTSFDGDGRLTTDFGGNDAARAIAIDGNGQIVVAGYTSNHDDFAVARYNSNGSLDASFGSAGKMTVTFGNHDLAYAMAIQSDGKIVLAGTTDISGSNDFAVSRLNANGSYDTTFGNFGLAGADFGADDRAYSVTIQADGKILVGGLSTGGSFGFDLARYNSNGSLDTTFDLDGKVTYNFGGLNFGYSVTVQSNGKIVIGGTTDVNGTQDFAIARLNADGSLDNNVVADFNGGGKSDMLWQNADGSIVVWTMNGTAIAGGGPVLNPGATWTAIGTGDFNADNRADIVLQNSNGSIVEWQMNGSGISGGGQLAINPGASWRVAAFGDVNSDGRSDMILQNTDGSIVEWFMNGTGVIGGGQLGVNPGASWKVVSSGNFNGDNYSDMLLQNTDGSIVVWSMNGTGIIGGGAVVNPGASWKAIASGDFNGDGNSDIVLQNTDGSIIEWYMNGAGIIGGGVVGANPGTSWHVKGARDYNADGYSDLLLQNDNGQVVEWFMNGTGIIGGGAVTTNPGSTWNAIGF